MEEFLFACLPLPSFDGGYDVKVLDDDDKVSEIFHFAGFWDAMDFRKSFNGV